MNRKDQLQLGLCMIVIAAIGIVSLLIGTSLISIGLVLGCAVLGMVMFFAIGKLALEIVEDLQSRLEREQVTTQGVSQ